MHASWNTHEKTLGFCTVLSPRLPWLLCGRSICHVPHLSPGKDSRCKRRRSWSRRPWSINVRAKAWGPNRKRTQDTGDCGINTPSTMVDRQPLSAPNAFKYWNTWSTKRADDYQARIWCSMPWASVTMNSRTASQAQGASLACTDYLIDFCWSRHRTALRDFRIVWIFMIDERTFFKAMKGVFGREPYHCFRSDLNSISSFHQ